MYYGVDENGPLQEVNPLDIDKSGFRPQSFMEKTLKESSLNQLYRQEERMKRGGRGSNIVCLFPWRSDDDIKYQRGRGGG